MSPTDSWTTFSSKGDFMSASTTSVTPGRSVASSSTSVSTSAFWEHLWRTSGLQFVGFFIITAVIYGYQPQVGASADALGAFYNGDRTRILIAAAFSGLNLLNLLWFAAALRTTLAEAGRTDGARRRPPPAPRLAPSGSCRWPSEPRSADC